MKEYLKILETDIYVIVKKNIDAWQNSRKMNENEVSETNYKLIRVLRIMLVHLLIIFLKYY